MRSAIAIGALAIAVIAVRFGVAASLEDGDPLRAAYFNSGNARALVSAARARIDGGMDPESPELRHAVRSALYRDLTMPAAVELRAVQLEHEGDHKRASRLFQLSNAISRRSLPTRLWLIQRSVERGDVAGALENFDLALRTSYAAPAILFPVLAGAASDPGLVAPIAGLLDRPSDWRAMFFSYAIGEGGAALPIANVLLRMRDRAAVTDARADQVLIGQLIEQGEFETARRIHDRFGKPRSGDALVVDPDFSDAEAPYPFGWGLTDSAQAGAARALVSGRAALAYRAGPRADGPVATQLLMLGPGAYRLVTATAVAPADLSAAPFWTVTCAGGGGQIVLLEQPKLPDRAVTADFTVPPGCRGQWLALNLRASEVPGGQSGAVRSVSVRRR